MVSCFLLRTEYWGYKNIFKIQFMKSSDLINTVNNGLRHVVILGTGASIASCNNNPEKNYKKVPLLKNIHEIIDIDDELKKISNTLKSSNDFECIFSHIYDNNPVDEIISKLEFKIYNYFNEFKLPETPTIYDILILALRDKDIIASFNWDPFLWQAYLRNKKITKNLPRLAFLHGNVAVGICRESKTIGSNHEICPHCNKPFEPLKLLYPIKNKGYSEDFYIKDQWNILHHYLTNSSIMTIFGYSAPKTDVEAVSLIKKGFINDRNYIIQDLEIIDIDDENKILNNWRNLINMERDTNSVFFNHIEVTNSFFKSSLAKYPRRTSEAFKMKYIDGVWDDFSNTIPENFKSVNEMQNWFSQLFRAEKNVIQ